MERESRVWHSKAVSPVLPEVIELGHPRIYIYCTGILVGGLEFKFWEGNGPAPGNYRLVPLSLYKAEGCLLGMLTVVVISFQQCPLFCPVQSFPCSPNSELKGGGWGGGVEVHFCACYGDESVVFLFLHRGRRKMWSVGQVWDPASDAVCSWLLVHASSKTIISSKATVESVLKSGDSQS